MKITKHGDFRVTKIDEDKKMVFGFFSISKVGDELLFDKQQDAIETEELENGAYGFVLDARVQGEGHIRKGVGNLIESMVFTYEKQQAILKTLGDMGIKDSSFDLGIEGWWGGFLITDDEVMKKINKGEYPMFSIGGAATERIELEE